MSDIKMLQIEKFLENKNIIITGVSHIEKKYSHIVYKEFLKCNYNVTAINPNTEIIDSRKCFKYLDELEDFEAALLILTKNNFDATINTAISKNIKNIWVNVYQISKDDISKTKILAEQNNINFIYKECPMMFLPSSKGIHNFHKSLKKIFHTIPE